MSKVVATYWNNSQTLSGTGKTRRRTVKKTESKTPQWFVFMVVVCITFMLCLAINMRAFAELREGSAEHFELNNEIDKLSVENLSLLEEIHNLRNDSETIEREARKIGMSRPHEKFLVPAN